MALDYTPERLTRVASATRQTAYAGSGTQAILNWAVGVDSLLDVVLAASPATTGGTLLAQAVYVDPQSGNTATADLINQVLGTGTTTGLATILAQGDQVVTIQVDPTNTGAVLVNASVRLVSEGA